MLLACPSGTRPETGRDTGNLAETALNPIADLVSVPFHNNANFGVARLTRTEDVLNIESVVPLHLGANEPARWGQPRHGHPRDQRMDTGAVIPWGALTQINDTYGKTNFLRVRLLGDAAPVLVRSGILRLLVAPWRSCPPQNSWRKPML